MTRKNLLTLGLGLAVTLILLYSGDIKYTVCGDSRVLCWQKFNLIFVISFFGPALLISSLISLKVSEGVFNEWKRMTYYFIPAYIIIITLMPWSVGDEIAGFTKGMAGLALCIGYTLLSVIYLLKNRQKNRLVD